MDYINAKGRIYDIQGYAVHDGPGIRTTVYTKGCPLRCLWCHSPESQNYGFELSWLDVKCIGADLCRDGGQTAMAGAVEFAGAAAALWVSLPLLESLLDLVEALL